ncbi:MAG: peptidylprolyl isomerase [Peptostreptococcaceae bacterium]
MKKLNLLSFILINSILITGCNNFKDNTAIIVNDENVSSLEVQNVLNLYKIEIESFAGEKLFEDEEYKEELKQNIINQISSMKVLYQEAKEENLLPTQYELKEHIQKIEDSINNDEKYKAKLEELGIDDYFIEEQQKLNLAIDMHRENFYKNEKISDEEIEIYYEENKDNLLSYDLRLSQIFITKANKTSTEAKNEIEIILDKIKNGENFEDIAKEFSEDKNSSIKSGDLGFVSEGNVPSYLTGNYEMLEVGQISDIISSDYGYHIVKICDKIEKITSLEESKNTIEEVFIKERYLDLVDELVKNSEIELKEDIIEKLEF